MNEAASLKNHVTAPPDEQLFGIAKKFTLEINDLPLHSQALIVGFMQLAVQHRKTEIESQIAQKNERAQSEAMDAARAAHARAAADEEERRQKNEARNMRNGIDPATGGIRAIDAGPKPELVVAP